MRKVKKSSKYNSKFGIAFSFSFFAFAMLGVLTSLYLIESGAYISEQNVFGFKNGSFFLYGLWCLWSFLNVCFLLSLLKQNAAVNWFARFNRAFERIDGKFLYFFCVFIFFVLFAHGLQDGFPLFMGVDRFVYLSNQSAIFNTLYGQLYLVSFLGGVISVSARFSGRLILLLVLILFVLYSNKFSALILSFYLYFLPVFLFNAGEVGGKQFLKFCLGVFGIFIVVLAVLIYVYFKVYKVSSLSALMLVVEGRAALQGHLFWGVVNSYPDLFSFDFDLFAHEFESAVGLGNGDLYGMHRLMVEIGGDIGLQRIDQGADFTMAYPGVVLSFSGVFGIFILQSLFILYHFFIIFLIWYSGSKGYFLCFFPLCKIVIMNIGFFSIGDLNLWIGPKVWFYMFFLFFFIFMYKASESKKASRR